MNPYENVTQTPEMLAWLKKKPVRPITESFKDFCEWETSFTKWSDEYDRLRIDSLKPYLKEQMQLIQSSKGLVKLKKQKGAKA